MHDPARLVDHFFRHESGRLTATLTRRFGTSRLQSIEESVQSALVRALEVWGRRGIPDNPSAWLTRVAHNALLDQLRRGRAEDRWSGDLQPTTTEPMPAPEFDAGIDDDELRMLFICCDERLPQRTQLVLALKLLCGFGTREIAQRLFLTEANVFKTLARGRQSLAELWRTKEGGELPTPSASQLHDRLPAVERVVYLLFNEGYSSMHEQQVIRRELCEEALRLGELLVSHPAGDAPSSWALLSLMHFHAARLDARVDENGELLLLEQQDRKRWDRRQLSRGMTCLQRASRGETPSRYHVLAAVLAEHCLAPSYEETRWSEIVSLYEILEQLEPSPLHTLNRAIALAEWQGPAAALQLLDAQSPPGWLASYYLWDATVGELARRCGHFERAERVLQRAIEKTLTEAERRVFARRLERSRARDSSR